VAQAQPAYSDYKIYFSFFTGYSGVQEIISLVYFLKNPYHLCAFSSLCCQDCTSYDYHAFPT